MKKFVLATGMSLFLSLLASQGAKAANFTFDPVITFEVGDGFFNAEPFDGKGDAGAVFPGNFDTVVKGTVGENSENAEFNISSFFIPLQETLTSAIFQANGANNPVSGSGVSATRPTSLAIRGYLGNGQADASDFQAGNILDTINVSPNYVQETYNFDVTEFIKNLVSNENSFAGFGIRAQDFGGLTLGNIKPKLIIRTAPIAATVPESTSILGLLGIGVVGTISTFKYKKKQQA